MVRLACSTVSALLIFLRHTDENDTSTIHRPGHDLYDVSVLVVFCHINPNRVAFCP